MYVSSNTLRQAALSGLREDGVHTPRVGRIDAAAVRDSGSARNRTRHLGCPPRARPGTCVSR